MPESQDTESILYKRQFLDRLNGGSAGRYTCMKYELCAIIRLYIDNSPEKEERDREEGTEYI
jgi:hypothetical protein